MEESRFDEITVAIVTGDTRRTVVRRMVGGGLTAALAAIGFRAGDEEVSAQDNCRQRCKSKNSKQKRRRCRQRCKDKDECKRNNKCAFPTICVSGQCVGGEFCTFDTQCTNGQTCVNGRCTGGGACSQDSHCVLGQVCVSGTCQSQICTSVTRTQCANEPGTCGSPGSQCVCLQEAIPGGRIACSEVGYSNCEATALCNPQTPNACPAGWLCTNNPCCPGPRCSPPCGVRPT